MTDPIAQSPTPQSPKPGGPHRFGLWQRLGGPLLFVAAVCAMVAALPADGVPSRDFLALWLAGDAVASGHPELIYPPLSALFEMRPPAEWFARAMELGRPAPVYPYLYPPIWAWLMAALTRILELRTAIGLVFGLNLALLAALPLLAARLAFAQLGKRQLWIFYAAALAMMIGTHSGIVALRQGQPQILVAFLTLLALERAEAGRAGIAGVALGFAIALKLAPLPIVVIWLIAGGGRWRPAVIALGVAGALGLASILIAGWPLHRVFLDQLAVIGHTLMINLSVASMDMLYGLSLPSGQALPLPAVPLDAPTLPGGASPGEGTSWVIAAKPAGYALLQNLLQLAIVVAAGLALRVAADRITRAAILATAIGVLAFTGPIGWFYYYLAPQAFAGLIVLRGGLAPRLLLAIGFVPVAIERFAQIRLDTPVSMPHLASWATAVFLLSLLLFARQSARQRRSI